MGGCTLITETSYKKNANMQVVKRKNQTLTHQGRSLILDVNNPKLPFFPIVCKLAMLLFIAHSTVPASNALHIRLPKT